MRKLDRRCRGMIDGHNARRLMLALTSITSGGLGSYALNLCASFKSLGWEVHLMVTNERGNLYDEACRSFTVHDLSEQALSFGKVKRSAIVVNRVLPDILLLNHCSLLHYALPLLDASIRPIAVVHSDDDRFYVTATMFARCVFRWVAPTRKLVRRLSDHVGRSQQNRIRLVPHGIDVRRYLRPDSPGRDRPVMTFAGFVDTNKGVDLLPEIMRVVAAAVPRVMLQIVGDGPLRAQLERDFQLRGLLDQCSFVGQRQMDEVAEMLKQSDVLVHPTRIEGFGLTIIEAMAAGVVPVVTRLQGITDDIVEDGVSGFLIEPNDVDGFAGRLCELLLDPVRRTRMARAATERVERYFSEDAMLRQYAGIFDEPDDRVEYRGPAGMLSWLMEVVMERLAARMKSWIPAAR